MSEDESRDQHDDAVAIRASFPGDVYREQHDDHHAGATRASMLSGTFAEPEAGQLSTIANTLCTMIGGGILATPLAFQHASVIVGLVEVVLATAISGATVYFLTVCCEAQREFTFRRLLQRAFPDFAPDKIGRAVEGLIVISNAAALVVYVKVLGQSAPPVVDALAGKTGFWSHELAWMVGAAVVSFPLSCAHRLRDLFVLSALGFGAVCYISIVIVIRFADGSYKAPHATSHVASDVAYADFTTGVLPAFSIILGALLYQMNVPPQYAELKNRSPRRMMCTAAAAYGIASSMYCSVGLMGYLTFGTAAITSDKSGGNILKLYRDDDTLVNIGRCALCLHFLCAFPIYAVVARRSLHVCITGQSTAPLKFRVLEALVMITCIVLLAVVVPGIGVVCQFTGALFGTTVACTIPSLIYARTFRRSALTNGSLVALPQSADSGGGVDSTAGNNTAYLFTSIGARGSDGPTRLVHETTVAQQPMGRWLVPVAVALTIFGAAETIFSVAVTIASLV